MHLLFRIFRLADDLLDFRFCNLYTLTIRVYFRRQSRDFRFLFRQKVFLGGFQIGNFES